MSVAPFDHPWLSRLLGDEEAARHFAPEADLREMLRFEAALALAEGAEDVIPRASADHIASHLGAFTPDLSALAAATVRDGVVVPELVRQLRDHIGPPHAAHVHFGATSQDVIDTSLVLRLRPALGDLRARLATLAAGLDDLDRRFGSNRLMGRTRMQDALPIRAADRIAGWRDPLPRHLARLDELLPRLLVLQFGGAVGTLDRLGDRGPAVAARLAAALDLRLPGRSWHTQRDTLAELASWLALVAGSLGKLGLDLGLMAQIGEVRLSGGGSSSAMPHKQNPVGAEVLGALAHFTATLSGGMQQAMLAEQERSGAAWTLEWLLLPQMVVAAAASLRTAIGLVGSVTRLGEAG